MFRTFSKLTYQLNRSVAGHFSLEIMRKEKLASLIDYLIIGRTNQMSR